MPRLNSLLSLYIVGLHSGVMVPADPKCLEILKVTWETSAIASAIQTMQGLLTPLIAVIVAYVAWQQWKLNERNSVLQRKLNERNSVLQSYDRRLRIYQEVFAFLALVNRDFKPEFADLIRFRSATAEANFLFGSDIPSYINEMHSRAVTLWNASRQYRNFAQSVPPGYDHNKVVASMTEQEEWFIGQYDVATEKFRNYLNIST